MSDESETGTEVPENEILPDQQEVTESTTEAPRNSDGTFAARESDDASNESTTVEETTAEAGESVGSEEPEPEREERNRSAQERIRQLVAQRNEARALAEAREQQLRQYQPQEVDPNLEFENPAEFTTQAVKSALSEQQAQAAAAEAQSARQRELQVQSQMFQTRVDAVRDEMPDFDQVFNQNLPVSEVAVEVLANSDEGARVAYYLGKNPNEAFRIANLPPVQQIAELTRLESKVARPPAKRSSNAPTPPKKAVGGGSNVSADPAKMTNEAYRKWREAQAS